MKMNWGYKIMFVLIAFVGAMAYMVSVAMKQTNDLQDEHYYVKELKHQDLIDAESRFNALQVPLKIADSIGYIYFQFPSVATTQLKEGSIEFLRASDKSKDRRIEMNLQDAEWQKIAKSELIMGLYKLRIKWQTANEVFYTEQDYFVNQ